jgi:hypothetical protein
MANERAFPYRPFDWVNTERQNVLKRKAVVLLEHLRNYQNRNSIPISEFGEVLNVISMRGDLGTNTHEKAVLWCFIISELYTRRYNVFMDDGIRQDVVDRYFWGRGTGINFGHILVSFNDTRHGTFGEYYRNSEDNYIEDPSKGRYVYTNSTPDQAWKEIVDYERTDYHFGFGVPIEFNSGDANASYLTVLTMFAFRDGGFAGFARKWNQLFLNR